MLKGYTDKIAIENYILQEIVSKDITEEEKAKEGDVLFNEVVELEKPTEELFIKLEEAGIKISAHDLTILEESLK